MTYSLKQIFIFLWATTPKWILQNFIMQSEFFSKFPGCGGRLTSATGSFSSPNYPLPYPSNRECIWDIIIQPGRYIHVEFHGTYHIEVLCFYMECACMDTLDIKDGNRPLPYAPHSG